MPRNRTIRRLLPLLLALLLLLPSMPTQAAKRPLAADISNGYMIIGSYLIHKDALNKNNLAAAKASMSKSGQGIYYKSEFADGQWFNIEKGTDITAILTGKDAKLVPNPVIDNLKITVWIDPKGKINSLQDPAEIDKDIAELQKQKDIYKKQRQDAVDNNDQKTSGDLAQKEADVDAQIAFLQALKVGNGDQASDALTQRGDAKSVLALLPTSQADAFKKQEQSLQDEKATLEAELKTETDAAKKNDLAKQLQENADHLATLDQQILAANADLVQDQSAQAGEALVKAVNEGDVDGAKQQLAAIQDVLKKIAAMPTSSTADSQKAMLTDLILKLQAAAKQAGDFGLKDLADQILVVLNAASAQLDQTKQAIKDRLIKTLQDTKAKQEAALQKALDAAQLDEAAKLAVPLADTNGQLAALAQGVTDKIADLQDARDKVQQEIGEAAAAGQPVDSNKALLKTIEENLLKARKEALFIHKQADQDEQVALAKAAGKASNELVADITSTIEQIKQFEKQKYTPEELAAIQQIADQIQKENKGIQPLPVESIISKDVDLKFSVPPLLVNGSAYIHIRPISEGFGATVDWDDATRTATILANGNRVTCTIDSTKAFYNDEERTISTPPQLLADRTFVPLRFVGESLGLVLVWDEATQSIEIKGAVQ